VVVQLAVGVKRQGPWLAGCSFFADHGAASFSLPFCLRRERAAFQVFALHAPPPCVIFPDTPLLVPCEFFRSLLTSLGSFSCCSLCF